MAKHNVNDAEVNSVDLCKRGMNPFADIKLFKSRDGEGGEKEMNLVEKIAKAIADGLGIAMEQHQTEEVNVYKEISDATTSLHKSLMSIAKDDLSKEEREALFKKTFEEFGDYYEGAIEKWAEGGSDDMDEFGVGIEKGQREIEEEEEEYDMNKMNIEKMSPEDKAAFEALKKKYGTDDGGQGAGAGEGQPAENEALKKALEEMEDLKKGMAMAEIKKHCEEYEILGKNTDETAEMLYGLKKSNPDAYDQVVKAFDEAADAAKKSDVFKEFGTSRTGGRTNDLDTAVTEVKKSNPELTHHQAVCKAYEQNPDLKEY